MMCLPVISCRLVGDNRSPAKSAGFRRLCPARQSGAIDVACSYMLHALEFDVEDLADTRFAISPLAEAIYSLWAIREPERHALHQPFLRSAQRRLAALDPDGVLLALIETTALPDFFTPRPATFAPAFANE